MAAYGFQSSPSEGSRGAFQTYMFVHAHTVIFTDLTLLSSYCVQGAVLQSCRCSPSGYITGAVSGSWKPQQKCSLDFGPRAVLGALSQHTGHSLHTEGQNVPSGLLGVRRASPTSMPLEEASAQKALAHVANSYPAFGSSVQVTSSGKPPW